MTSISLNLSHLYVELGTVQCFQHYCTFKIEFDELFFGFELSRFFNDGQQWLTQNYVTRSRELRLLEIAHYFPGLLGEVLGGHSLGVTSLT